MLSQRQRDLRCEVILWQNLLTQLWTSALSHEHLYTRTFMIEFQHRRCRQINSPGSRPRPHLNTHMTVQGIASGRIQSTCSWLTTRSYHKHSPQVQTFLRQPISPMLHGLTSTAQSHKSAYHMHIYSRCTQSQMTKSSSIQLTYAQGNQDQNERPQKPKPSQASQRHETPNSKKCRP